ncbi:MAG: indolepyruvate ferredoxin oxidoreductase subunit alpha, partial [Oscillospiraceae bacterium]|nr:indolepyruvate ferredoxin oxidoreductase subunit alpha [Oscillospiraceae bacterium]
MSNTELILGNEAVARGLYEAGCRFVSSYPGTPSTEITECAAGYDGLYAEWAPNEKVAVEAAFGASLAGARAFSGMKHVGLNVAADPVFTASYTGVNAGLVIAVADDPGMHSSQNEQDSRHYARAAKLPMLEPADSAECLAFAKLAFDLSEQFDTPVLLRLATRVSHSRSGAAVSARVEAPLVPYEKKPAKYVMMPGYARARHAVVEKRLDALRAWAETAEVNRVEWGDRKIGVVAAGIAYQTAREALGDNASYLKLGAVWPLPDDMLRAFAAQVERLYVVEELDGFIEAHCRALGLAVQGKALFSPLGEYTPGQIKAALLPPPSGVGDREAADGEKPAGLPGRPPALCPGCPHRGLFYVLNKLKLTVTGDIGCYTLAAAPPLGAMDVCVCMGASISSLHGLITARPEMAGRAAAVIGDST